MIEVVETMYISNITGYDEYFIEPTTLEEAQREWPIEEQTVIVATLLTSRGQRPIYLMGSGEYVGPSSTGSVVRTFEVYEDDSVGDEVKMIVEALVTISGGVVDGDLQDDVREIWVVR